MFHVFSGIIYLYLVWRFVLPLSWGKRGKGVLAVVLLLIAEHHLITRTFFGNMASPEIPFGALVALGWMFGAFIVLFLLVLLRDIAGIVAYRVSRYAGHTIMTSQRLRYGMAAVAMILSAYGVWEAVRVPGVNTIEITLQKLPQALDGMRIVQLTDLHASRLKQAPWMEAVVAKTNALHPDLTVITGDLVDGTPEARAADVAPLQKLTAKYGVIAIPGNHEYYTDYLQWLTAFQKLGLPMLLNDHVTITIDQHALVVAGVTDTVAARFGLPLPDLARALEGVNKNDPVILLSHRPTGALANAAAGVDLQLSGHTHGGQIIGPHLLAQVMNEGFVSGLYQVGSMQLYVSNGTGLWNGFPVRLGRPAEITQIVLRAGANAGSSRK